MCTIWCIRLNDSTYSKGCTWCENKSFLQLYCLVWIQIPNRSFCLLKKWLGHRSTLRHLADRRLHTENIKNTPHSAIGHLVFLPDLRSKYGNPDHKGHKITCFLHHCDLGTCNNFCNLSTPNCRKLQIAEVQYSILRMLDETRIHIWSSVKVLQVGRVCSVVDFLDSVCMWLQECQHQFSWSLYRWGLSEKAL